MRRMTIALLCAVVLGSTVFAQTQAPQTQSPPVGQKPTAPPPLVPPATAPKPAPVPFPTGVMIGFVQFQAIVAESKLGKCGQDTMKQFVDKHSSDLLAKQKAAQDLQQQITTQTGVVNDTKIAQMNRDLDRMQRDFNSAQEQVKADQDALNQELLDKFQASVLPVIETVRAEKGLWAILTVPESGIAAAMPGLDVSSEVVKKLDIAIPTCGGK
jgi:Skp family chaperone for outer membrane proteins